MSHKNANTFTVGQLQVDDVSALKAIPTIKGAGPEATQHRHDVEEGRIVFVRNFDWPPVPDAPDPDSVAIFFWDPMSLGWADTGIPEPEPPWIEAYVVRPNDTGSADQGRWINAVPLIMLGMMYESGPGPGGGGDGMKRLYMNPLMWYDNGDGLGIADDITHDLAISGYWYAVPFRVDHTTTFTEVGIENVILTDPNAALGFAIYHNDDAGETSRPVDLLAHFGFLDHCVAGANILRFAANEPYSFYPQPLTLQPGWYWLAFCQVNGEAGNNFRAFSPVMQPSTTQDTNNNTAHLGYYDVTTLHGTYMVRTQFGSYDVTTSPPQSFDESGPIEPETGFALRIMLRVDVGGFQMFNIEDEDGGTITIKEGVFTDDGGPTGDYAANKNFSASINIGSNFGFGVIALYTDTVSGDILTLTNSNGQTETFSGQNGVSGDGINIQTSPYSDGYINLSWDANSGSTGPGFELYWDEF